MGPNGIEQRPPNEEDSHELQYYDAIKEILPTGVDLRQQGSHLVQNKNAQLGEAHKTAAALLEGIRFAKGLSGDERRSLYAIVVTEAKQRYSLISQKFTAIDELCKLCREKYERADRSSRGTQKDIENLDIASGMMGRRKQLMGTINGENDLATSMLDVQLRLLGPVAKNGNIPESLREIGRLRAAVLGRNYDFSDADKGYAELLQNADTFERRLGMVDEALARLSRGVPLGPEVYALMRTTGMLVGGADTQQALKDGAKRYAESRLGVGGRIVYEAVEHRDEIRLVAQQASALAGLMPEILTLIETYAPAAAAMAADQASAHASTIIKTVVTLYLRRKYPTLAATEGVLTSILNGATVTRAAVENRRAIKRAARQKGGVAAREASGVAIDASSGRLMTNDQKIAEFRKQLTELCRDKLDPALLQELSSACEAVIVDALRSGR